MKSIARRPGDARDPLRAAVAEVVRAEVAQALAGAPPSDWIPASALGLSSRQARRLATVENLRATRMAGRVYLCRADVDELARRNALDLSSDVGDVAEVRADLKAAFGAAKARAR